MTAESLVAICRPIQTETLKLLSDVILSCNTDCILLVNLDVFLFIEAFIVTFFIAFLQLYIHLYTHLL